jgi:uridine phosphorylase
MAIQATTGDPARDGLSAAELGGGDARYDVENLGGYTLLPGDPERVTLMARQWDEGAKEYTFKRLYRAATGTYKGAAIAAFSTGIGGPSAEGVITNLCSEGVHTFIRVGTTGAIQEHIQIGDIIINDASVRLDGTSNLYVRPEYPSAASFEVTLALVQACENLGYRYHVGTGCTTGSFFAGQCRVSYGGYKPSRLEEEFADLRAAGVLNFEMEGSALFTLLRLFGKRAGLCASVIAHRLTGEWDAEGIGEPRACLAGAEAIRILHEWDRQKQAQGKPYFYPGLWELSR